MATTRPIRADEKNCADELLARARAAMQQVYDYDQARVDRLCQAVGVSSDVGAGSTTSTVRTPFRFSGFSASDT